MRFELNGLRALVFGFFLIPLVGLAQEELEAEAKQFHSRIQTITRQPKSADRMTAVIGLLEELKVAYRTEGFEAKDENGKLSTGKNLIVDLNVEGAKKQLLIGAHFDQVGLGQGAVDNACSCAVLLEMIERFHAKPLEHHNLRIIFFDLEEAGLVGSAEYVKALKADEKPRHFLNFDIFGYGDSFWLMCEDPESPLVQAFSAASEGTELPVEVAGAREYPPGDHLSFVKGGISTVAVALIDKAEIKSIQSLLAGKRTSPPPILRTIHTPDDTVEKIEQLECARALPIVEAAIRKLDAPSP